MDDKKLGEKILRDKINRFVYWFEKDFHKPFNPERNKLHVVLNNKQWYYVKKFARLRAYTNTYEAYLDFYRFTFTYNNRLGAWQGYGKHDTYQGD